ncbi:MAG: T9SS type A sorting domain-containing protein [Vicingaceae bacterium]|nr:T9SS type A sorting domain-containing protein [Vicingaceae bacterium]
MKKIFTILTAVCIATVSFGQTVFQSNLSSWASGDPTDWMGSTTNIASARVVEKTGLATYGTSMASLINTSGTHNRFTTQSVTVVPGESYLIEMWVVAQNSGELRTGYYDVTNSQYTTLYNPYIDVAAASGGNLVMISQTVTVPANCTSAEFILSLRNTDATTAPAPFEIGILVDSVAITSTTPPVANIKKIYDIQFTTNPNGDSPEVGNIVTTKGVITGIVKNGPDRHAFFIQDSALAWNGLYIYERNDSTLAIGDSVEVTGTVAEFNGLTELSFVSNITVLNSGNTLPTPVVTTTGNANAEEWEGVLIQTLNAECVSNTNGFGMWEINDGSTPLLADDDIFAYHLTAVVGSYYDVTGIGHYSFGDYKILPRDANDISLVVGIDKLNANNVAVYPNPANDQITFQLKNNGFEVIVADITGKVVATANTVADKLTLSLDNLNNGIYFYTIKNKDVIIATNKFVVVK